MAPMLHDAMWRKLAEERETLCFDCMLDRATERQVNLSLTDLLPCPFNLRDWPDSYFNLFRKYEEHIERAARDQWRAQAWKARHLKLFPADVWSEI